MLAFFGWVFDRGVPRRGGVFEKNLNGEIMIMASGKNILVYISSRKDRITGGMPGLVVFEGDERETLIGELEMALNASVVQLKNGDHILVTK